MQFAQGWDDTHPDRAPVNLDLTIAEIRGQEADAVLLQEIEQARPGGVQPDPPPNYTRLREALGGYDSYFSYPKPDPRELPFGIGLAIFSKTPLRDALRRDLPSPPIEFAFRGGKRTPTDRLLIGAKTTLGWRELRIVNTHLLAFFMLKANGEDHLCPRELVLKELRESPVATLLGGDFNVSTHEPLVRQFADASGPCRPTRPHGVGARMFSTISFTVRTCVRCETPSSRRTPRIITCSWPSSNLWTRACCRLPARCVAAKTG